MFNDSIHYKQEALHCDDLPLNEIVAKTGTPTYIYSQKRILENYTQIKSAFAKLDAHIHYSAKANNNHHILKMLVDAGAGIDAVSGGEVYLALNAGCSPENIVFAGVGKSREELRFAIGKGVGWINVENIAEIDYINEITAELGREPTRISLRLNPDVTANTHPYIATGHGGAKFGLTATTIADVLAHQDHYEHLTFSGIHVHIGSQLHDTTATQQAIKAAINLIEPYPNIRTLDIGGGLPVAYTPNEILPSIQDFVDDIYPLVKDYELILEPGRAIVADAGLLLTEVLYVKQQAGQIFYIVDASMSELIRPALYQAHHEILPVIKKDRELTPANIVGPVCETADVLGRNINLPPLIAGDLLAVMTTGAYGMVMASNYNARPRPAEIMVNGTEWKTVRERETWASLMG
ncbi:MAG: diaminopimelate decarboxylase [Aggregatilineales bacterium]